tara:strand:+ start:199 stop:396 length:198 start_codon:yes stop_codon:yes gene_type:complete
VSRRIKKGKKSMAGGPLLSIWEKLLPFAKDLRVRFAIAMLGNVLALWFLSSYFKNLIPNLPPELS